MVNANISAAERVAVFIIAPLIISTVFNHKHRARLSFQKGRRRNQSNGLHRLIDQ
jgi:hypothetical protein